MVQELTLAADFAAPTREQWLVAVGKAIKGADFDSTLVSTTLDGIRIEPLYTADDVPAGQDEAGFPGLDPLLRGAVLAPRPDGRWDIRTSIEHPDPATANAQALHDLANGATSVELVVRDDDALPQLLAGIVLDAAPVALRPVTADPVATARAYLAHLPAGAAPAGTLGLDPATVDVAAAAALAVEVAGRTPNIRTFLATGTTSADAGASEGQEVGAILAAATHALRALVAAGLPVQQAARQIALEATADVDIFATIAKLRALRFAWGTVLQESGVVLDGEHDRIVDLAAVSSFRTLTVVDPWVNLLRGTAACLGAVLGGADTVTVAPFDGVDALPGDLGRRLARNTQLILGEESGIGRVLDLAGGSWYVEALTDAIAGAGWAVFQGIDAAGGPVAAMPALAAQIEAAAQQRDEQIARRSRPITGVSEFPQLGEQRPGRTPAPPPPPGPLPRRRLAQPYEELRTAGESAGATIFLANLGPAAVHTARATFAANLFAAGGVAPVAATVTAADAADAFRRSGATVACLCSSDGRYAQEGAAVATALRTAGARRVYLAGRADIPGVDETVALGADALAVLTRLHETLEIA
jgi:methylmalonyl-CoA mutase